MEGQIIRGPIAVQAYATACTHCHIVVTSQRPKVETLGL
jgi:hypothetical protein